MNKSRAGTTKGQLFRPSSSQHLIFGLSTKKSAASNKKGVVKEDIKLFFNDKEVPGYPTRALKLKNDIPIKCLRNIDFSRGLVNGARLFLTKCSEHILVCKYISGPCEGEAVFIPRIPFMVTTPGPFPVEFRRLQYPVKVGFAMKRNEAQGHRLNKVGAIPTEYAHGKFYIGLPPCI